MKHYFTLIAAALILCACETNDPKQSNHPTNPYTWSPVGHIYIYEETWDGSPAPDKYWVWVLNFTSKDSVIWYETDQRDLTYNGSDAYSYIKYNVEYPKLTLYFSSLDKRELVFKDTTSISTNGLWGGFDYTIIK